MLKLLVSGMPQRGIARFLGCSKNTVDQRLLWLSTHLVTGSNINARVLYIDEMETLEHTKLKPLTLPLAVSESYQIVSVNVGRIPAKGHLAELSRKKYDIRANERVKCLEELFLDLKRKLTHPPKIIQTDGSITYKRLIEKHFPLSKHEVFISRELTKKKKEMLFLNQEKKQFDPLFPLNQRCAKLRADIRRLTRRSWCTTKKPDNLKHHLKLYEAFQAI